MCLSSWSQSARVCPSDMTDEWPIMTTQHFSKILLVVSYPCLLLCSWWHQRIWMPRMAPRVHAGWGSSVVIASQPGVSDWQHGVPTNQFRRSSTMENFRWMYRCCCVLCHLQSSTLSRRVFSGFRFCYGKFDAPICPDTELKSTISWSATAAGNLACN